MCSVHSPKGLSNVFDGVLTTGNELLCLLPLRNPVELVSTSDIMPGSSSKSIPVAGGYPPLDAGDCKQEILCYIMFNISVYN